MTERISIIEGDITRQNVAAIVNAANTTLLGGGGVDGAIHRAAGPKLLEECRTLNGCETGEAKITKGYNLPARWIIHTVGPVWNGGHSHEDELLRRCYSNGLSLAAEHRIRTIAFPSISTGAYGFPIERASRIALKSMMVHISTSALPEKITIVCFSHGDFVVYTRAEKEMLNADK
jgi:O-acetyl-ADP-ribose deacetylase (regulator of RNase III)